jgi:hypothetical protein
MRTITAIAISLCAITATPKDALAWNDHGHAIEAADRNSMPH